MTRLGEDGKVNGMYDDIGGKMSLTVKWCDVMCFCFFFLIFQWRKHWFVLTNQSLRFYRDSVAEEVFFAYDAIFWLLQIT